MSDIESRQYIITGEVSPGDWQLSLRLLGKLGIAAAPFSNQVPRDTPVPRNAETLPAGTIPYTLKQISSASQYLSSEHLGEFWPEYRDNNPKNGGKNECLAWGINLLTHPRPKGVSYKLSGAQQQEYASTLGIETVSPRSIVGFSDEYASNAYGLWNHEEYGDAVIEVGSFIDSVRHIAELPVRERPWGVDGATLRFFLALSNKLEEQLTMNPSEGS